VLNECAAPTRRHYSILALSFAGWLFDFYDLVLFSFLLVPIGKDLSLSDTDLSLLLGATLGATALGGVAFGFLADRFGRKPVLSATILTYSLGSLLCGFAPGPGALLVFRVLTGLGIGGEWATGQTMVGETFPPRLRARFAAVMQTGAPVGVGLAAIVGSFVEPFLSAKFGPHLGWRLCFIGSAAPALLVVAIRRVIVRSGASSSWVSFSP
jgi:MFS family permease